VTSLATAMYLNARKVVAEVPVGSSLKASA
jgi:hypothetical protein